MSKQLLCTSARCSKEGAVSLYQMHRFGLVQCSQECSLKGRKLREASCGALYLGSHISQALGEHFQAPAAEVASHLQVKAVQCQQGLSTRDSSLMLALVSIMINCARLTGAGVLASLLRPDSQVCKM